MTEGIYARASAKLHEKLFMLKGQWFTKSDACDVMGCLRTRMGQKKNEQGVIETIDLNQEFRDITGQVLYNWSNQLKDPVLEQRDKKYRVINKEFKVVKPGLAKGLNRFDLSFPRGVDDNSSFRFEDSIVVNKRDVIGLGGEGNKGKSCFALNIVVENMDKHPVTLVLSENILRLEARLSYFDWVNVYKPDGDWKFEVLEAHKPEEFLDIARERKDNLIVFDWLNVTADAYRVSEFYEALTHRFDNGVGVVVQQKRTYKTWVVGGEAAYDYCSAFFLLQSGKIQVVKVKVPGYFDPSNRIYRFKIEKNGSRFSNIAEVYDCPQCKGKKYYQGEKCGRCYGLGYLDVMDET